MREIQTLVSTVNDRQLTVKHLLWTLKIWDLIITGSLKEWKSHAL